MNNQINKELVNLRIIRVGYNPELIKYCPSGIKKYYDDIDEYTTDLIKALQKKFVSVENNFENEIEEYIDLETYSYLHIYEKLDKVILLIIEHYHETDYFHLIHNLKLILDYLEPKVKELSSFTNRREELIQQMEDSARVRK